MPNPYFHFKQFTVYQQHTALKVCTDACLLGAWVAAALQEQSPPPQRILDIGTGTGLLALMLAQATTVPVDAIDIEPGACRQAEENFAASPWSARLRLWQGDVKTFSLPHTYDCIISNPPFFENDLHAASAIKNMAKHDATLTLEALLLTANRLLNKGGSFAVLLPFHRTEIFESMAVKTGFNLVKKMVVKQTPQHDHFRSMLYLQKGGTAPCTETNMVIRETANRYSKAFTDLLQAYYL
jgi:tRNA1Val (adenine37-N6)-methyltransferase